MSSVAVAAILFAAAGASGVGDDPFSRASDVFHFSFTTAKDDREFDHQPDDWTRRRGAGFPTYVKAVIDDKLGRGGGGSLRFDVNGGAAIYYSPPQRVDALHAYVFEGFIRTQRLRHDAALISLSFLNHRRQRVQRVFSTAVSGTHKDWVRVRMGPVFPHADVKFVVVGCHLVNGRRKDLTGRVWFDDLRLGRIPQLSLVRDIASHFKTPDSPIEVTAKIGGLDRGHKYRVRMALVDHADKVLKSDVRPLSTRPEPGTATDGEDGGWDKPTTEHWNIPPQTNGFYRVKVALQRDNEVIIEKELSFAVAPPFQSAGEGVFGWTIERPSGDLRLKDLLEVIDRSGINWMKYSLWRSVADSQPHPANEVAEFFHSLSNRRIKVGAILDDPPANVRAKFPQKWTGVREIFTMPKTVWWPAVEPTIARFSASVRHWQIGSATDQGFTNQSDLPKTVNLLKTEFDTLARDIRVGIPWNAKTPLPLRRRLPHAFLTFVDTQPADSQALEKLLTTTKGSGLPRWISIQPLPRGKATAEARAADLVKRLVLAKANRAEAIFAFRVFDPKFGLLHADGSPTALYLPWRTAVEALRGADYLGSLALANGSRNFVFDRNGEGIVVLWNPQPTTEEVCGDEAEATVTDVWGRSAEVVSGNGKDGQLVKVRSLPTIVRGCSGPVLRWKLSTQLEVKNFESRSGSQNQALLFENAFPQGINGKVTLVPPRGWLVHPRTWRIRAAAGEKIRLPMTVKVPANVSQGTVPVKVEFQINAVKVHRFVVRRQFRVVMGDMAIEVVDRKLPDGRLEIRQTITNNTRPEEILNFRCTLLAPGVRRQRRTVIKLGRGKDRRVYYLPNAEALRGESLWVRAEQIDGNRVLNLRWKALETRRAPKKKPKQQPKITPTTPPPGESAGQ